MKLVWVRSQTVLRKGRAALLFSTRLPFIEGAAESIATCYQNAARALEQYADGVLLPRMDKKLAEEPRRNRLHATLPNLQLLCDGEVVQDRWISLTLSLHAEEDGDVSELQDHRVWDGQTGRLCPLEFFLSPKEAKHYCRWSFYIHNGRVGALSIRQQKWTLLEATRMQGN